MAKGKTACTATIRQRVTIPAPPEAVYKALTNARLHAGFTEASATGRARAGYGFTAWDGYIEGKHLVLQPGHRIVQEWRTTQWPSGCSASRLEFRLRAAKTGTELTMVQYGIPASQARSLRSGWAEYYWKPLRAWFAKRARGMRRSGKEHRGVSVHTPRTGPAISS